MAMSDEELVAIASLLEDDYAREILVHTSIDTHSASELADACGASEPTIYRRIEDLIEQDLLEAEQELDPDGHHYKTYAANLEAVTVELHDGEFSVEVSRHTDPADRFTELYDELR
jgi:predicted ArsR family transcriptional regulator